MENNGREMEEVLDETGTEEVKSFLLPDSQPLSPIIKARKPMLSGNPNTCCFHRASSSHTQTISCGSSELWACPFPSLKGLLKAKSLSALYK